MAYSDIALFFISVSALIYLLNKYKFSYWKNRNVLYKEPTFLFGNLKDAIVGGNSMIYVYDKMYYEAKSKGIKYFGMYHFWSPVFVCQDLELIKNVLHKDYEHFMSHSQDLNHTEALNKNLFSLDGNVWKDMRVKLTPAFTSGKIKLMFQTVVECTKGLQSVLQDSVKNHDPLEIKDVLARFTTDVIGSVGFGIEINSLKNPDSEFRKRGDESITFDTRHKILLLLRTIIPKSILQFLNIKQHSSELTAFFTNLVQETVKYREENNVFRKDFMHLLIQLKNFGKVTEDNEARLINKDKLSAEGLTLDEMVAQAFLFYLAGFETSSTTMTFALLELALNQEIQEKTRNEIRNVLKKHSNEITYEAINDMEYLEMVVQETLRRHPPVPILPRACTKDYKVPDSDLVIKAGTNVSIPVYSIHRDPEYYPDPDKFDPERFSPENKAKIPNFAYMPFGEGPRICIGLRFAKYQTKVGMCSILNNYRLTVNKKTQLPIRYDFSVVLSTKGNVYLDIEPIEI